MVKLHSNHLALGVLCLMSILTVACANAVSTPSTVSKHSLGDLVIHAADLPGVWAVEPTSLSRIIAQESAIDRCLGVRDVAAREVNSTTSRRFVSGNTAVESRVVEFPNKSTASAYIEQFYRAKFGVCATETLEELDPPPVDYGYLVFAIPKSESLLAGDPNASILTVEARAGTVLPAWGPLRPSRPNLGRPVASSSVVVDIVKGSIVDAAVFNSSGLVSYHLVVTVATALERRLDRYS